MNRALPCVRLSHGQWIGSIPYLLGRYVACGRSTASFPTWLGNFRGESRPLQDLSEYLKEQFDIIERSLETERDASPEELRYALQKIWHERYERRRERYEMPLDEMAITHLVNHDVECYTGVVQLRTKERASPFGYSAWWLTVDRKAFDLKNRLRSLMSSPPPDSPVMSADFLVNSWFFGPIRRRVTSRKGAPSATNGARQHAQLTPDLITEAENLRLQLKDLPERVIRRQVRDHLIGAFPMAYRESGYGRS